MAAELSNLVGYGSGEDDDDQMMEDAAEGAGGKVILVGHSEGDDGEHEDESVEELPLLKSQQENQQEAQVQNRPDGDSPISHVNGAAEVEMNDAHPLEEDDDWLILPPELREAPPGQCSEEMLESVTKVLHIRHTKGTMFSRVLQDMRPYRNPDFLEKMISHFNIQDRGSNFAKDVFDPYGLPAEDYIDAMEKQLIEARAKREQERASRKAIDFTKGASVAPRPAQGPALTAQVQAEAQAKARQMARTRGWDK